eukprot:525269_1
MQNVQASSFGSKLIYETTGIKVDDSIINIIKHYARCLFTMIHKNMNLKIPKDIIDIIENYEQKLKSVVLCASIEEFIRETYGSTTNKYSGEMKIFFKCIYWDRFIIRYHPRFDYKCVYNGKCCVSSACDSCGVRVSFKNKFMTQKIIFKPASELAQYNSNMIHQLQLNVNQRLINKFWKVNLMFEYSKQRHWKSCIWQNKPERKRRKLSEYYTLKKTKGDVNQKLDISTGNVFITNMEPLYENH